MHIFVIIITAFYCPLRKDTFQEEHVFYARTTSVIINSNTGLTCRPCRGTKPSTSFRPSSPSTPILRHLLEYWMFINLKKTCLTKTFDMNVIVITKYIRQYFQHLVDKGFIKDAWTPFCINFVYQSTFLHPRLCNMHTICCLHHVGKILEGN